MPTVLIVPESMINRPTPYADLLREAGFEVRYPKNAKLGSGKAGEAEMIDELSVCQAVIAAAEPYTAGTLAGSPQLRVIARAGVGFDRVDMNAATEHDIAVTITPTANHEAVAEQALAMLFAVAKSVVVHDRNTKSGRWREAGITRPVRGSTLGIWGLGRIGRSTAVRASSLGMNVIATESQPDEAFVRQHDIELVDFSTLLARSDYLTLHCPLTDETQGRLDRRAFAQMKPGSVLINTARGGLVVEEDLYEALCSGQLRAAALDVFEKEPPELDNRLLALENVVTCPHLSGIDTLSLENMGMECAQCIVQLHQGQWPSAALVNRELEGGWKW